MRHRIKGKKLSRNIKSRQALFKDLVKGLILNEQIKTTEAKAKAVKGIVDKLMTKAKNGSVSARRQVLAFLPDKKVVSKLFDEIAPRTKKRTSGFTRIVRLIKRRGDNATMANLEFVDKPTPTRSNLKQEVSTKSKPDKKQSLKPNKK